MVPANPHERVDAIVGLARDVLEVFVRSRVPASHWGVALHVARGLIAIPRDAAFAQDHQDREFMGPDDHEVHYHPAKLPSV